MDQEAPKSDYVMKCVRVDRCWALSRAEYGDGKWHRLPAGSVAYRADPGLLGGVDQLPLAGDGHLRRRPDAGGRPCLRRHQQRPDLSLVETTVVDGTSVADTLFMVAADGGLVPTRSVVMRAQAERVPVSPPPRRKVGRPATEPSIWRAVINS